MKRMVLIALVGLFAACSSSKSPPADGGVDAADGQDGGQDAGDTGGDESTSPCGNGKIDEGEECDGTETNGVTCQSLRLPEGQIGCTDDCKLDTSGCAVCADGICSDGETAASCPDDCGVMSIAAGRWHTCAVLADHSLWCWGAHQGHQMGGTGDTNVPVRLVGVDDARVVMTGFNHNCYTAPGEATGKSKLYCWGLNGYGEAGRPLNEFVVFPPAFVAEEQFLGIALGSHHTCYMLGEGMFNHRPYCFGRGDYGNRGDGTWQTRQPQPVPASSTVASTSLVAGGNFTCAAPSSSLALDGASCWGDNSLGQLGVGDRDWRNQPAQVPGVTGLPGAGYNHMCMSKSSADPNQAGIYCAGSNSYGQLGQPASEDYLGIVKVSDQTAKQIVAGWGYTCIIDKDDHPLCWGDNYFGQLGDGTTDQRHTPAPVQGIDTVLALSGGYNHVCAILPDRTARCWGDNRFGQLGSGSASRYSAEPVAPLRLGPAGN